MSHSVIYQNSAEEWPRHKPRTALSNHQDSLRWDPDNEQSAQTRILKTIIAEREKRAAELLEIQRQRQELVEQRMQIDQAFRTIDKARYNVEAREAKIVEVQDILPSARQLKDLGIDFHQALVFINVIQQKAEEEKIDLKSAAYGLEEEPTNYRRLGGIQKSIEQANQQLAIIEAFTAQKQQAVTTLMNLHAAGFSEKEITELTAVVNTWNKSMGSPGLSQGNGFGKKLDDKLIGGVKISSLQLH